MQIRMKIFNQRKDYLNQYIFYNYCFELLIMNIINNNMNKYNNMNKFRNKRMNKYDIF